MGEWTTSVSRRTLASLFGHNRSRMHYFRILNNSRQVLPQICRCITYTVRRYLLRQADNNAFCLFLEAKSANELYNRHNYKIFSLHKLPTCLTFCKATTCICPLLISLQVDISISHAICTTFLLDTETQNILVPSMLAVYVADVES